MILVTTIRGLEYASTFTVGMIQKNIATAIDEIPGKEKFDHIGFFAPDATSISAEHNAPAKHFVTIEMKLGVGNFETFRKIRDSTLPNLLSAAEKVVRGYYPQAIVLCQLAPFDLSDAKNCRFSVPETVPV